MPSPKPSPKAGIKAGPGQGPKAPPASVMKVAKAAPNPAIRQAAKTASTVQKAQPAVKGATPSAKAPTKSPGAVLLPSGSGGYYRALKAEFILGLLLLALYPLVVKKTDPLKWGKRIIALWITFVMLMTAAKIKGQVAKIAAGLGGLITLGLLVYGGSAEEGLLVSGALGSLAKALQVGGSKGAHKSSDESNTPTLGHSVDWPTDGSQTWSASGLRMNGGFGNGTTSNGDVAQA